MCLMVVCFVCSADRQIGSEVESGLLSMCGIIGRTSDLAVAAPIGSGAPVCRYVVSHC